jgi:calcium/calmodulin-dependent protein kinase I
MPLFGKKDSGKKVRKDNKDIDKQIINIEDKYHLRQVLGK